MNPKLIKRIRNLHRNCRQMPVLCVLSLFVPIVLPFVVPLCLVYASQRTSLLNQVDGLDLVELSGSAEDAEILSEEVDYIRNKGSHFYLPVVVAIGVLVVISAIVLSD